MKKKIRILSIFCCAILLCVSFFNLSLVVQAGNAFRNSDTKHQLFAVPEGGWSSITVEVTYTEMYNSSLGTINLYERSNDVAFIRGYATSMPTVSALNVKHSNGKYFQSWTQQQIIWDPTKRDGCDSYINKESVTYQDGTDITGALPYIIACDGGVPASVTGSVSLSFR